MTHTAYGIHKVDGLEESTCEGRGSFLIAFCMGPLLRPSGGAMNYKDKRWQEKRKAILVRDKYQCQYFKRFGKIVEASHVHHIFPVEVYPEYAYCSWNLISLSNKAHNMMHERGSHELTQLGLSLQEKVKEQREKYDSNRIPPSNF